MIFYPDKRTMIVIPMKLYPYLSTCRILKDTYYNEEKYLIQTRSQAKSIGI